MALKLRLCGTLLCDLTDRPDGTWTGKKRKEPHSPRCRCSQPKTRGSVFDLRKISVQLVSQRNVLAFDRELPVPMDYHDTQLMWSPAVTPPVEELEVYA